MQEYGDGEGASCTLEARIQQWQPLLQLLLTAPSPVGAAVRWVNCDGNATENVESRRRRRGAGAAGELWKLVPQLLAVEVAYLEQQEDADATKEPKSAIGNCMWMQTLPGSMQANILSFLSCEISRFHSRDLEKLCRRLLSSKDLDFWVLSAAESLLVSVTKAFPDQCKQSLAKEEPKTCNHKLFPAFLLDLAEEHQVYPLLWLPFTDMHLKDASIAQKQGDATEAQNDVKRSSLNGNNKDCVNQSLSNAENNLESTTPALKGNAGEGRDLSNEQRKEYEVSQFTESKQLVINVHDEDDVTHDEDVTLEVRTENDLQISTPPAFEISKVLSQHCPLSDMEKARSLLGNENFSRAASLRELLLHYHPDGDSSDIMEAMKIFWISSNLEAILSVIKPWRMDDNVSLLLVQTLLGENEGFAWATKVLNSILLPKLISLKQVASRVLMMAVLQAGQLHPRATLNALLIPLLAQKEGISSSQSNVLNRLIKECLPPEVTSSFWTQIFSIRKAHRVSDEEHLSHFTWTESLIGVIQTILDQNLVLEHESMNGLVVSLEGAVAKFACSIKFGNVLFSLVSKYGSQLKIYRSLLQEIGRNTNTFMTKLVLAKLDSW